MKHNSYAPTLNLMKQLLSSSINHDPEQGKEIFEEYDTTKYVIKPKNFEEGGRRGEDGTRKQRKKRRSEEERRAGDEGQRQHKTRSLTQYTTPGSLNTR